ncbi:glycosyltransferase family 8 protein [Cenococcum geophilum 1.58]|uniref:glycosyltransferase family 8 protein n=1 Tax=Cenococcum geophilum 1.58 TaxID=794803 RepID=UPI003590079A|nr:glycosyltransferase family 8 protein [Cenococcum geophilum 1.58]
MTSSPGQAVAATNLDTTSAVESKKVWTTLITNTKYLTGLLVLNHSLKKQKSAYPLVALYTNTFPKEGHKALDVRGIPKKQVKYLLPSVNKDFSQDPRFYDCWSKLTPFSLVEYDRVVQLDSDMLVLRNMDELMDLELDPPSMAGKGNRVFAASHACVCNPLRKPHYPKEWVPEICAFTSQHETPDDAQIHGAPPSYGLGMPNGGLQVVNPSGDIYSLILDQMSKDTAMNYDFADQSLLSDIFSGRWVAIPYIYNALKTLRLKGVHHQIWRDEEVKNVHYILSPKPWDEKPGEESEQSHKWWWKANQERLEEERSRGIDDGF